MALLDDLLLSDNLKPAVKDIVEALKPHKLTIAEVRQVLRYIDKTIDNNVVLE